MPTSGYMGAFWNSDPRRWARCRAAAAKAMLAEGWVERSKKFPEVQCRRAMRLWREGLK